MNGKKQYRHEYKFGIGVPELERLRLTAGILMGMDEHLRGRKAYQIRSVYFDDPEDSFYHMNEAGVDPRVKYRIRCYEGDDGFIRLEKKIKRCGMTRKESCMLSRELADLLINGQLPGIGKDDLKAYPALLNEFVLLMHTKLLRPKVMVVYDRSAYINRAGNVRVTFDTGISACVRCDKLFDRDIPLCPVMEPGRELMEVKYDELLPGYIKNSLDIAGLRQETFSKYYLCRKKMRSYM